VGLPARQRDPRPVVGPRSHRVPRQPLIPSGPSPLLRAYLAAEPTGAAYSGRAHSYAGCGSTSTAAARTVRGAPAVRVEPLLPQGELRGRLSPSATTCPPLTRSTPPGPAPGGSDNAPSMMAGRPRRSGSRRAGRAGQRGLGVRRRAPGGPQRPASACRPRTCETPHGVDTVATGRLAGAREDGRVTSEPAPRPSGPLRRLPECQGDLEPGQAMQRPAQECFLRARRSRRR
jgi:hypothetical protein